MPFGLLLSFHFRLASVPVAAAYLFLVRCFERTRPQLSALDFHGCIVLDAWSRRCLRGHMHRGHHRWQLDSRWLAESAPSNYRHADRQSIFDIGRAFLLRTSFSVYLFAAL